MQVGSYSGTEVQAMRDRTGFSPELVFVMDGSNQARCSVPLPTQLVRFHEECLTTAITYSMRTDSPGNRSARQQPATPIYVAGI